MSTEPQDPLEQQSAAQAPVTAAPAAQAPTHHDVHTAQNTTMTKILPPEDEVLRDLTQEEQQDGGFLTVFLGNRKEDVVKAQGIIGRWLTYTGSKAMFDEERLPESVFRKAESDWLGYIEEKFPGKTSDQVATHAADLYAFMSEIQDELKIRTSILNEPNISNTFDRGGVNTGDIVGKRPSASTQGFSNRENMRRRAARKTGSGADKLAFDVLCRDSFATFSFSRTNHTEMGSLMNDIRRTITGYVQQIGNNSAVLARIASIRVIWNFIAKRINNSSVTDLADFNQLANVILLTDMDTIITALIESTNTKGINLNLRCFSGSCDWEAFKLVQASKLLRQRHNITTPADEAIYANLINGHAKYTMEETRAMSRASTYGLESNRVYNDEKSMYLECAPPTLAEAFAAFDFFIGEINPELAELRTKLVDPAEYQTQVTMVHNNLGSTEFIHWVQRQVDLPAENTDEVETVFARSEMDPNDFNGGILDVLRDQEDLNRNLVKFVLNKTPYMSRTFMGVRNYVCPKCRKNMGDLEDPENLLDRKLGYTPIDPVMSFFTLTQWSILKQTAVQNKIRSEALSE
jgi:hypothetical protein